MPDTLRGLLSCDDGPRIKSGVTSEGTRSLFVLIMLLALTLPLHADYQAGLDAFNAARYTTAMEEWQVVVAQPREAVIPTIYAETHYAIGMLHWKGLGVAQDYAEASKWFHQAAALGQRGAQAKLGYLYTEGVTVSQDYQKAFEWFSKSAKQGDVDGQYNLGIFYLNGWGTKQDYTMAAQYLAAASAQGDEAAETALQDLLASGITAITAPAGIANDRERSPAHAEMTAAGIKTSAWILTQNPDRYTIQVIGLSDRERLEKLIEDHQALAPFATYTLRQNNKPLYMLIQGSYPSVGAARKVRDRFPASIQKPGRFWIRTFAEIQALIGKQGVGNPPVRLKKH